MKKLFFLASLVCMVMATSCTKDELVPEDEKPEWLGSSIYEELKSGQHLSGTFNTYLRLVDDLGYDEVLGKTGSKTIFPANDEAFAKFFASNNSFGVKSYEELNDAQKKVLLYTSMLDNAMLASMLSNIKADDNNVTRGIALKHETNLGITDNITTLYNGAQMPQNNPYWDEFRQNGINVIYDGTKQMLVHFTREQMINNNITTEGADCDFGILRGEVQNTNVTNSDTAYIFKNKILNQDIVCTNGYIHQVENVIEAPGNVAQALRRENNTKLFSRILDYHCAPYWDVAATNNYNAWAIQNGQATIDKIYQVRYFTSGHSQGNSANYTDPSGNSVPSTMRLLWDPGWNSYYPSSQASLALADMGAILVPTDEAIEQYFLPVKDGVGGGGAYFIDLYGALPNTKENLPENLDALFNNGNGILTTFVNNLMQTSFIASVPSKFGTITQSSGDFMNINKSDISLKADGSYDIVVANNGVIYKMKDMIAPDEYQSVIGPVITYPDMTTMKAFTEDKTEGDVASLYGADLYYFLMAMKANYAFFIPTNDAMSKCYIDPVSLATSSPRALEFYFHKDDIGNNRFKDNVGVKIHNYDPKTGVIDPTIKETVAVINVKDCPYKSQISDMLSYNTVVLEEGETFGKNHYYRTKHGGAIYIDGYQINNGEYVGTISGGAQIDNNLEPAHIQTGWREKNGWAFRIDGIIQPSITSIYKLTNELYEDRFSAFKEIADIFADSELLAWAGISATAAVGPSPQEKYQVFDSFGGKALDSNIKFFNGYNYTFFAPDNDAMNIAHDNMGLPKVKDIKDLYDKHHTGVEYPDDEIEEDMAKALNMLNALRSFIRYHFMNNSVFADNDVAPIEYQSMYSTELGIPLKFTVSSTNGVLKFNDRTGKTITIKADDNEKLVNKMTRDYQFNANGTAIELSSFAVVHEINTPLCYEANGRYDNLWNTPSACKAAAKNYSKAKKLANNLKD